MKIYCIEDTSGLKYVGSTKKKYLCNRMSEHRAHKKTGRGCSSEKLDLKNAKIYLLEECDDNLRKEHPSKHNQAKPQFFMFSFFATTPPAGHRRASLPLLK